MPRALAVIFTLLILQTMAQEPNPPEWPASVRIIRPTDSAEEIQAKIADTQDPWNEEHQTFVSDHHFSSERYLVWFAPGEYHNVSIEVGYYSQVAGLGVSPDDVRFLDQGPHVPALNRHIHEGVGTCLDTFWRAAENFRVDGDLQWAVSQAAPLRRVHVGGDLYLHDGAAFASGGHFANGQIDGHVYIGGQQQYLLRNVGLAGGASGGAWSMVYVGCDGDVPKATEGSGNHASVTVLHEPRLRIEKPYVAVDGDKFFLRVPQAIRHGPMKGPLTDGSLEDVRDFTGVYVARPDKTMTDIQRALDDGKDIVFSPGIYDVGSTLVVRQPDQVLLGLGLATIVAPSDGSPCIRVESNVPGVRIAGLMLEASQQESEDTKEGSTLLEWGKPGSNDPGQPETPGALFDIFCRVGGATMGDRKAIAVDTMMKLHSGNLYADDLWLWRADHAELRPGESANYPEISPIYHQSEQDEFRAETGLEVTGDDITIYGLAVEHANGHQTVWSGHGGQVAFYQCELPYGVSHDRFGESGYTGYLIHDDVESHEVHAPGIYTNFRNEEVKVPTAITHPEKDTIQCINPFTVRLDNHFGVNSIVNGQGRPAAAQGIPVRLNSREASPK